MDIISALQRVCQFNFGKFEREEFKKFSRMGLIFAFIIGIYWTLRPLKDSIFIQLVGKLYLPYAKTVSVIALLPLVMFYTKLLEKFNREKMLKLLPAFYGIAIFVFSLIISYVESQQLALKNSSTFAFLGIQMLGYVWYLFVESFGSLVVALFWAFASDTTDAASAKKGFAFVYMFGQLGGIIFPYTFGGLPHRLGHATDLVSMLCLSLLSFLIVFLVNYLLKKTPAKLLASFHGKNEQEKKKEQEPGFIEGLKLVLKHRYLIGIFAVNFIFEIIVTIFDFNFKLTASEHYNGVALSNYLSMYASSVNAVSLFCLLFGISNITRFLGVGIALSLMPIIFAFAIFGFLTIDTLSFLFALMVGSKAINYALNGPALKQLYVPTTKDVRFKAQAWIETFGSRSSKQTGSIFNMSLKPLQSSLGALAGKSYYLFLSAVICFPLLGLWLIVALFLGRKFKHAINEKRMVC